ncbi:MAG: hypothetical protein IJZ51_00475 [Ruminiclostridium sp.]|nr:hypothetical protein [Ruminiclostridium sp.]
MQTATKKAVLPFRRKRSIITTADPDSRRTSRRRTSNLLSALRLVI